MKTLTPKKALLLISFSLLYLIAAARPDSLRKKQFFIGAFFSPTYTKIFYPSPFSSFKFGETFSPRMGIEFKTLRNRKYGFSTGILFDIHNYRLLGEEFTDSKGNKILEKNLTADFKETCVIIPFRFDWRLNNKKLSPFFTVGVSNSFLYRTSSSNTSIHPDGSVSTYTHFQKGPAPFGSGIITYLQIGAGLDLLFNRCRAQLYPIYESGLSPNFSQPRRYFYRHKFGLGFSFSFSI